MLHRTILALLAALLAIGCGGDSRQCFSGSECASGICGDDGVCVSDIDAGGDGDSDAGGVDGSASCTPNHDGVLDRSEVLLAAGRSATFRVALDVPVNTAGELEVGGERRWSFAGDLAGDTDVLTELAPLTGAWYEDLFPDASYSTRLSQTEELLGVFEITESALLLRGIVSPAAGLSRTELTYDPPIVVFELPLRTTSSWTTSSSVSGLASGVASLYNEDYEQQVDAVGTIETPFGDFPVVRVRIELTRTVGLAVVTVRSFSFIAECFGIVGQVSSQDFETEIDFTDAAEVRRLSL